MVQPDTVESQGPVTEPGVVRARPMRAAWPFLACLGLGLLMAVGLVWQGWQERELRAALRNLAANGRLDEAARVLRSARQGAVTIADREFYLTLYRASVAGIASTATVPGALVQPLDTMTRALADIDPAASRHENALLIDIASAEWSANRQKRAAEFLELAGRRCVGVPEAQLEVVLTWQVWGHALEFANAAQPLAASLPSELVQSRLWPACARELARLHPDSPAATVLVDLVVAHARVPAGVWARNSLLDAAAGFPAKANARRLLETLGELTESEKRLFALACLNWPDRAQYFKAALDFVASATDPTLRSQAVASMTALASATTDEFTRVALLRAAESLGRHP